MFFFFECRSLAQTSVSVVLTVCHERLGAAELTELATSDTKEIQYASQRFA